MLLWTFISSCFNILCIVDSEAIYTPSSASLVTICDVAKSAYSGSFIVFNNSSSSSCLINQLYFDCAILGTYHSSSGSSQIAWAFFLYTNKAAFSAKAFSLTLNSFSKIFILCFSALSSSSNFSGSLASFIFASMHCLVHSFTSSTYMPYICLSFGNRLLILLL